MVGFCTAASLAKAAVRKQRGRSPEGGALSVPELERRFESVRMVFLTGIQSGADANCGGEDKAT